MSILHRVDKCLSIIEQLRIEDVELETELPQTQTQTHAQTHAQTQSVVVAAVESGNDHSNTNAAAVAAAVPVAHESFKASKGSLSAQIMDSLQKLSINVTSKSHIAVSTSEAHFEAAGDMRGTLVKNILVKEKRHKQQYLVVYPHDKQSIDLKVLGKHLGVGGGLRFVRDCTLTFQVERGCITPLAVLFDEHNVVECILDQELKSGSASASESGPASESDVVLVHPGTNTATVGITLPDLELYFKAHGNGQLTYLDLNQFIGAEAKKTDQRLKAQTKQKIQQKQSQKKKKKKNTKHKNNTKHNNNNTNADEQKDPLYNEGITFDKRTQFGEWYKEIVTKCELIDYTDISGCYVLRPRSYFIWEQIQAFMDVEIKKLKVQNAYFPLFVSEAALRAESTHFDDFNPEVAWVTHSGNTKLDKRIAVRPTSETIIYPLFAKWIRSFRDLPLRVNQWCNVVRWEFSHATPFLRTREFLWQEGHTAHATQATADAEVLAVLDMYARTYAEVCAIPMIKGTKTKPETFPGADYTTTVEGYIPGSGRGIQGATSHCLGQNFAKMFNITFLDEQNRKTQVIQNSWGFTTRSIGVMIMTHSDNKGLVVPPKCAQIQVVIVPIVFKCGEEERLRLQSKMNEIHALLTQADIRVTVDDRVGKKPGFKFNEWELMGVPVRIEIGPRDMKSEQLTIARRDKRDQKQRLVKTVVSWNDNIVETVSTLLEDIHRNLYDTAKRKMDENIVKCREWKQFLHEIHIGKLVLAPHCLGIPCEKEIAVETTDYFNSMPDIQGTGMSGKAKVLCIPMEQPQASEAEDENTNAAELVCVHCKATAKKWLLFGRSY